MKPEAGSTVRVAIQPPVNWRTGPAVYGRGGTVRELRGQLALVDFEPVQGFRLYGGRSELRCKDPKTGEFTEPEAIDLPAGSQEVFAAYLTCVHPVVCRDCGTTIVVDVERAFEQAKAAGWGAVIVAAQLGTCPACIPK